VAIKNGAEELAETKLARNKLLFEILAVEWNYVSLGAFEKVGVVFEFQSTYGGSVAVHSYFGNLLNGTIQFSTGLLWTCSHFLFDIVSFKT